VPDRANGRTGFPVVVSGPSGVGKTTICRRLLAEDSLTAYSVSVTTRPPRGGEEDGRHYEFVPDVEFDELVASGQLAEWALVHGYRYGTRKRVIEELSEAGLDVVMDVDIQGGMSIKSIYPQGVLIFILPPSYEELEERLRGRATDDAGVIETRLRNALEELTWVSRYDYVVVNDDLDRAVDQVRTIVDAERLRVSRYDADSAVRVTGQS